MTTAFLCPSCQAMVGRENEAYVCVSCNRRYPEIMGVPILVKDLEISRQEKIDDRAIADLATFLKSERGTDLSDQLRDVFGLKFNFKDAALQVEAAQFLNRMRATGLAIGTSQPAAGAEQAEEHRLPHQYGYRSGNVLVGCATDSAAVDAFRPSGGPAQQREIDRQLRWSDASLSLVFLGTAGSQGSK